MANEEHLAILRQGVEAWNRWRQEHPDLARANLVRANLEQANLRFASLERANINGGRLWYADLRNANLQSANLACADLIGADLEGADLRGADLLEANLVSANLAGANLAGVVLFHTAFGDVDISRVEGLADVQHVGPSTIGADTLERTAAGLSKNRARLAEVEAFLRGAGVAEHFVEYFCTTVEKPIDFYSCFISYSHSDKSFARRMYEGLQGRGIRCWLDEHQLKPGDDIYDAVGRGIRLWDKVLLCCSDASLASWWVNNEIDTALEKERKLLKDRGEKVLAIIPLNLDGYLFDGWQDGRAAIIRKRLAADFTGSEQDNAKYESQFERVVAALRTEREAPPKGKL